MTNQTSKLFITKTWHHWESNKFLKKYRKKSQITRKLRTVIKEDNLQIIRKLQKS